MIFYYKILIGLLAGMVLGALNFYLMRAFVRLAVSKPGRGRGIFIIILSYLLRYLLIGALVFALLKINEQVIALSGLAVLVVMTILLAVWQHRKKSTAGR